MVRILKHLFCLLIIKIPLQVVGIGVLFIYFKLNNDPLENRLPTCFKWFGVWEGKDYGVNGDAQWQLHHAYIDKDGLPAYKNWYPRFKYNALRNPVNHFQWEVLGKKVPNLVISRRIGDDINTSELGWYYEEILQNGAWELLVLKQYPLTNHAFRARIGYKVGNPEDKVRERFQWAFSITPWKNIKD